MTTEDSHYIDVYIDFEPNQAKTPAGRLFLEEQFKSQCAEEAGRMVSRLAELDQILTTELGEYSDYMGEARQAFLRGLWRAVVAMIGIAAERFRADLYSQIKNISTANGKPVTKESIFGREDSMSERRKLQILKLFGIITPASHDKLHKIKKLRDRYIHPSSGTGDIGSDAREAMKLFQMVLKERFDAKYTIREGKIVPRQNNGTPTNS